ncbi:uncharacterized protein LOC127851420 [Dreissena polymorpha]|uniref:Uncharacterized protein n=1 Tax=Dreissena polymorpha TaxID=45954 RepID=A0A9D4HXQ2_DREPO|nr:uncharacterized protein LOC127851420 [Dreissena polymorpha]KAH3736734.1 hypothetical protein DPMN_043307 [Dreissena polymorpha]
MSTEAKSARSEPPAKSEPTALMHSFGFNPNPKTINWERLELLRLQKLRLGPERYSRHFQRFEQRASDPPAPLAEMPAGPQRQTTQYIITPGGEIRKSNSIAPFATVGKPTCGFFFSRVTDNKKKKIGIPPTNLVKWRSFVQ